MGQPANSQFQNLLLFVLLNAVGAALAMPGDVEEEGFCIDGDVVAGFCLGPEHSANVQGYHLHCSDIY